MRGSMNAYAGSSPFSTSAWNCFMVAKWAVRQYFSSTGACSTPVNETSWSSSK